MKATDARTVRLRTALLVAALVVGLFMPMAVARMQDALTDRSWPLYGGDAHYVYAGTLRNRALALNSYRNGAHTVSAQLADDAQSAPDCWQALSEAGLLPPVSETDAGAAHALALTPPGGAARYEYLSVSQTAGEARLNATVDAQTGLCLVVEARLAPEELRAWLGDAPLIDLLRRFAAYWGYSDVSDTLSGYVHAGLTSQSAAVTGTYYTVTVMALPQQGLLMYVFSSQ